MGPLLFHDFYICSFYCVTDEVPRTVPRRWRECQPCFTRSMGEAGWCCAAFLPEISTPSLHVSVKQMKPYSLVFGGWQDLSFEFWTSFHWGEILPLRASVRKASMPSNPLHGHMDFLLGLVITIGYVFHRFGSFERGPARRNVRKKSRPRSKEAQEKVKAPDVVGIL